MRKSNKLFSKRIVAHKIISRKIKNGTVKQVIFKSILFSTILSLLLFMIVFGYFVYKRDIKHSLSMLEEESRYISAEVDHYFEDILSVIDILYYLPGIREKNQFEENQQKILTLLSKIETSNQRINRVFISYEDNTLLINDSIFPDAYNLKEATWYSDAMLTTNRSFNVGNFPNSEKSFNPKFIISKSFSIDGKNAGVISVDCQLDSLYSLFSLNSMFDSKEVMLANMAELIVLSETPDNVDQITLANHPEIFDVLKTHFTIEVEKHKYHIFSQQLSDLDWRIISRISYSEITSPIHSRILFIALFLLIVTLVISKLLAQVLGKTIAKPVIEVGSALESLAKGHRNIVPIHNYPHNEIGIMAESFNTFLETTKGLKSDISELQETKDKLSYSLSLLDASLESTDDGVLIVDNDKYIIKVNKIFLAFWGLTEDEIKSKEHKFLISEFEDKIVDFDIFYKTIVKTREDRETVTFDVFEIMQGPLIACHSFPQKINHKVVGRVWRCRDITKEREAEILLQDSEKKFRNAITYAPYPLMIHSEGKVLQLSEEWTKQTGYTIADIPTINEWTLKAYGKDAVSSQEFINNLYTLDKMQYEGEWQVKIKDGSYRLWDFSSSPIEKLPSGKNIVISMAADITERKQAEELLRESENKLNLIINSSPFGLCTVDKRGNFIITNHAYEQMVGYSKEELLGLSFFEMTHPEDRPKNKNLFQNMFSLETTGSFSMEKRYICKNGKEIYVSVNAVAINNAEGKVEFGTAFVEDITERKQALEQIKMLSKMPSENPNPVLRIKQDGTILYANNSSSVLLQAWKSSISNKLPTFMHNLVHEIYQNNIIKEIELNVNEQIFALAIVPIAESEILNIYGKDITKIRESEQKYRVLFENMTSGFALHEMVYDKDGEAIDYRFLDINPAFEKTTGLKAESTIGRRLKEVLPNSEEYWVTTYGKVVKTGQSITYEQYSQDLDKYFEVRAFTTEQDKFATIFSDVTSRVKALNELEKEKELAQAATKAKSEFLANMSHEIRTPLNGVIGFTDLLLSTELSPIQRQFSVNANISGKALLDIINDILDFSKIEAGKMDLDIVSSSVTDIMEQAIDIIKFSACKKGVDVILNIPLDLPEKTMVDPLRLKQILLNLLNNAVKFTDIGEIELMVKFTPVDEKLGNFMFSIRDTGIGISDEASKRLFQAFSQADGSITRRYGGTGLGLVISNFLADKMNSKIEFKSEEKKGSNFYFTISTEYFGKPKDRKDVLKGNKILIADKNKRFKEVLKSKFEYWGVEVDLATNEREIRQKLLSTNYKIILIDDRLINEESYKHIDEIVTKSKINKNKIYAVIFSGPNHNIEVVKIFKDFDVTDILTKPIINEDLFKLTNDICSNRAIVEDSTKFLRKEIDQIVLDKQLKILIAEDVEMNMILIRTLLKKIIPNVEVYEAKNGMEAVLFFKEYSPDIILMDIQMPELDGLEATKAIKKIENKSKLTLEIPIIALTAAAYPDDKEKCLKAGMVDFLTKPISIKELTKVLGKYLLK